MKGLLITCMLAAAAAAPSLASAQSFYACQRSNQASDTEGAFLGAAGGALTGTLLGGHHSRGLGAVLGALGGGIVGDRIADASNDPCYSAAPPPQAYVTYREPVYVAPPPPIYRIDDFDRRFGVLGHEIRTSVDQGYIGDGDAHADFDELQAIRSVDQQLVTEDGGELFTPDQRYIEGRLDRLSARLHQQASY